MKRFSSTLPDRGSPGVALIVTLMMMAVLVMMVVGLAGVMRSEQAASRNLTYQVTAEQLAEIGARQGMAAIASNSPSQATPFFQATGPGWVLRDGTLVPLFSTQTSTGVKNVEEVGTNSLILSLSTNANSTNAARGTLLAGWSNISVTATSPPIGRFAWWVDDEGGKLNVNYAGSNNARIVPWASSFPFQVDPIFLDPTTGAMNSAAAGQAQGLAARTNWIFTTESLKDTNTTGLTNANFQIGTTVYGRMKGHVTAWGSNLNLNPYGQRKYSLTNLANPATITNSINFDALMSATFRNSNLTNSSNFLTFQQNFELKYGGGNTNLGRLILRQAMANAYEAMRFNPTNMTNLPLQTPNLTSFAGTGITNIPQDWQGLTPASLYLNEICAQAFYFNIPPDRCQIQIWVYVELINLNSTNTSNDLLCLAGPDNSATNRLSVSGTTAAGPFSNNITLTGFFKTNGSSTVNIGGISNNVPRHGFFTTRAWFVFAGMLDSFAGNGEYRVPQAGTMQSMSINNFRLGDVVLLRKFNRGRTLVPVDWVQRPFPAANFGAVGVSPTGLVPQEPGSAGAYSFSATDSGAPTDAPNVGANAFSFSKIDPRFRVFPSWTNGTGLNNFSAWTTNRAASFGTDNRMPAAALPGWLLVPDTVLPTTASDGQRAQIVSFGTNFIWTNTNVPAPAWSATGTNFPSAGALGYIHTGLPWRTFRLSAQGTDPDPPDWLLLDLFSAGPATNPVPALNLNTQYRAMSPSGGVNDAPTFVTNRLPTVLSLFYSLTNTNIPAGFWSSAWNSTTLSNALTNLNSTNSSRWIGGSWWNRSRATATGVKTNPGLFLAGGELAEIRGVGDAGATDADREAAMMAVGDLVSARSDTFSVWSIGQGLQVLTNAAGNPIRTNVLAEIRKQTVFQRVPQLNVNGDVTGYQMRVLYTRNHIVE